MVSAIKVTIVLCFFHHSVNAFVSQNPRRRFEQKSDYRLFSSTIDGCVVENEMSRRKILGASFGVLTSGLILPRGANAAGDSIPSVSTVPVPTIHLGGGKSSLKVSRTIQGYWQLAGGHGSYREVDAIENMQAHFNAGITTLDTADIYGPSELIVGKFIKSQPSAIPCTKFCCFRYLEVSFHLLTDAKFICATPID